MSSSQFIVDSSQLDLDDHANPTDVPPFTPEIIQTGKLTLWRVEDTKGCMAEINKRIKVNYCLESLIVGITEVQVGLPM